MSNINEEDVISSTENKKSDKIQLTQDEYQRLGKVRLKLWLNSLHGGLYGATLGLTAAYVATTYYPSLIQVKKLTLQIKRNYWVSSFLLGAAFGMVLGEFVTYMGQMHFRYTCV